MKVTRSVAGRDDTGVFNHQDDAALRGAGAMNYPPWHDKALLRIQLDRPVFQVDEKASLDDIKEFIVFVVLVPMILALKYAEPHHRVVYPAERLIVPLIFAGIDESRQINQIELIVENVEVGDVWVRCGRVTGRFGHASRL